MTERGIAGNKLGDNQSLGESFSSIGAAVGEYADFGDSLISLTVRIMWYGYPAIPCVFVVIKYPSEVLPIMIICETLAIGCPMTVKGEKIQIDACSAIRCKKIRLKFKYCAVELVSKSIGTIPHPIQRIMCPSNGVLLRPNLNQ